MMGSTYSRKRVNNDIHIVKKPSLPRNDEDGSSTSTIERSSHSAHKQSLHSLNDYLNPNGEAITCTLRRNGPSSHHSSEILNTTSCLHEDSLGGSSVVGDRLCHYSRDSTIPINFDPDNKAFSSVFTTDPAEITHKESLEDDNKNLENKRTRENTFSTHRQEHLSTSEVISLRTGEELDLMTVHELYNCLNDGTMTSYIMDPFYILILDLRAREDYDISHIVTAQPADIIYTELVLLFNYGYIGGRTSLRDFTMVVVCGEASCDLEDTQCPELKLYHELQDFGIQPSILKGGYQAFHNQYPFLCSSIHITDEQERKKYLQTYPSEIIEGKLYQGRGDQATSENVVNNLNITHIVNVCTEHRNAFPDTVSYLNVDIEDLNSSCLKIYFSKCYGFIRDALDSGGCVLVHCNLGMSRSSTISLSYLMETRHWTLQEAYNFMKSKRQAVKPNRAFLRQLCDFEEELFGKRVTDPDDIWF